MSSVDNLKLELPPSADRNSFSSQTDDSPLTNTSGSSNSNSKAREIKKRNRIPVSCNECRRRKLRCDRKDPCTACAQRGDADGCKFTEPLSSQPKSRAAKPGSRDYLQQRIHRLESLVTDLAAQVRHNSPPSNTDSSQSPEQPTLDHSDASSHTSPSNTNEEVRDDPPIDDLKIAMGDMKISNGKVLYTSGNSWNTILDEIADIKQALNPVYSSYAQGNAVGCGATPQRPSSFPFFAISTPSITDLLVLLPTRVDTEILVHKFMTNMFVMCPCLHRPTFLEGLKEFYKAPETADPIFLGTLFAVLSCGISIYKEDDGPFSILVQKGVQTKKEMATVWRDASMQAFCLGGFLTNTSLENLQGLIVLHTFVIAFQATYGLGWPLYGMILSIALNMGLHRDGAQFNLDPFQTEMRRRLWSILVMLDGLNAASYGRPMMISDTQFDTKPLAAMNDAEFRPGCKIPPSLPSIPEEIKDTTYLTCKLALTMKIRKIIASLFGIKPPSYDAIIKIDAEIRQTYDSFPSRMKFSPGRREGAVTEVVQSLGLRVIMNHALLILHRPFLHRSFRNPRYVPSREKCLDAAHQVLELFHEYRTNSDFAEFSWYAMGALHAFHAGTVVGLRCYLEPLTCADRDWRAVEMARSEFEKIGKVDGWEKLGEKATKVFSILIKKAFEKKAILEGALGQTGIHIGPSGESFDSPSGSAFSAIGGMPFTPSLEASSTSGSTGFTPQYTGSLFPIPNQFDLNPLTNPHLTSEAFNPAGLQGAGMPGVVANDSSPNQENWDALWPKGMNLSEWDMFFENMDVDFTNNDSSAGTDSSGLVFDQGNPFATTDGNLNGRMAWNFGNPSFGNGTS